MKKFVAVLLTTLLLFGTAAVAAQAAALNDVPDKITVYKGFAKKNADYFVKLDKSIPGLTFASENAQFTIDRETGKMKFSGGPGSVIPPTVSVYQNGVLVKEVKVNVQYEWYEYFVIIFAAGYFWIYTINN